MMTHGFATSSLWFPAQKAHLLVGEIVELLMMQMEMRQHLEEISFNQKIQIRESD